MNVTKFAVFDVETTGLGAQDRIIEIGVVQIDILGNTIRKWQTLINPNRKITNSAIHHISNNDVQKAPYFEQIINELAEVLNGCVLVAHNAEFDTRFLNQEFSRLQVSKIMFKPHYVCTLVLSKRFLPLGKRSLAHCLAAEGIVNVQAHSALADAQATAELFSRYLKHDDIQEYALNREPIDLSFIRTLEIDTAPPLARNH